MTPTKKTNLINLKKRIAASRQKLQDLYTTKGTTDEEVLAAGAKLDQLINEYHQYQK